MLCSYCKTETQTLICEFCGADLQAKRPQIKKDLSENDAFLPQPTLATFHTYDLLILLQHLRKLRSDNYKLMQSVRKAPDEVQVPSETISFAEEQYKLHTAHMKVIEGILIDRQGYKPKRVDDKLLGALQAKMERSR